MAKRERNFTNSEKNQYRINEDITSPEVRLVGEDFNLISEWAGKPIEAGIYPTRKAIEWANTGGIDLVEISPNAIPPVAKIIEFQKFLYNKKKKDKELKAKTVKTVIKEIRFGPNTDDHDFDFKVKHAKSFLEEGAKVRAFVQFRGRSIVFMDRGELLLLRFLKELEEYGVAENLPKLEGKKMGVVIAPKKTSSKPK